MVVHQRSPLLPDLEAQLCTVTGWEWGGILGMDVGWTLVTLANCNACSRRSERCILRLLHQVTSGYKQPPPFTSGCFFLKVRTSAGPVGPGRAILILRPWVKLAILRTGTCYDDIDLLSPLGK